MADCPTAGAPPLVADQRGRGRHPARPRAGGHGLRGQVQRPGPHEPPEPGRGAAGQGARAGLGAARRGCTCSAAVPRDRGPPLPAPHAAAGRGRGHRHLHRRPARAAGHHPAPARGPRPARCSSCSTCRSGFTRRWPSGSTRAACSPCARPRTASWWCAGSVLIAPAGRHMKIRRRGRGDAGLARRRAALGPAPALRRRAHGLRGQGATGARAWASSSPGWARTAWRACARSARRGARTLAESEETCVIYGMPKAAVEAGVVDRARAARPDGRRDPGGGVDSRGADSQGTPLSLTGNLEDLPLLDILQIVSFSKKTGYLSIRTEVGRGRDRLPGRLRGGRLQPGDARPSTRAHRQLPPESADAAASADRIERGARAAHPPARGPVQLQPDRGDRPRKVGARDISDETLPRGHQRPGAAARPGPRAWTRTAATRRRRWRRRSPSLADEPLDAEPPELVGPGAVRRAAGAEPLAEPEPLTEPPAGCRAARRAERPAGRRPLRRPPRGAAPRRPRPRPPRSRDPRPSSSWTTRTRSGASWPSASPRGGYNVVEAEDPDARRARRRAGWARPAIAVPARHRPRACPPRAAPRSRAGSRWCKRLWKMNLRPPVLLMAETLTPALQARARADGDRALRLQARPLQARPGAVRGRPARRSRTRSSPTSCPAGRAAPAVPPRPFRSRAARRSGAAATRAASAKAATAPAPPLPRPPTRCRASFEHAPARLEELRRCQDATQISALVMRVAREFFERGVLFLVKDEELRGLGGFGAAARDENARTSLVREIAIPLGEPSLFARRGRRAASRSSGPGRTSKWAPAPPGQDRPLPVGRLRPAAPAHATARRSPSSSATTRTAGAPLGRLDALDALRQPGRDRPRERVPAAQGPAPDAGRSD